MKNTPFSKAISSISFLVCLMCFSPPSIADPYFISYNGIISGSDLPGVNNTEAYVAILVFDNGSTSAVSQTWGADDLTCGGFLLNDAQDAYFAHDLTKQGSLFSVGSITTDGTGVLSTNFVSLVAGPVDPGSYLTAGITLTEPIHWFMNDANNVLYSDYSGASQSFGDAADGVQMDPANWSNPAPWTENCGDSMPVVSTPAVPIPFAPPWALVLLTGLLVLVGAKRLIKR